MTKKYLAAVIDLETTGLEIENAHIIEYAIVFLGGSLAKGDLLVDAHLVKPPIAIPVEASSINHIVDDDVKCMLTWEEHQGNVASALNDAQFVVAHNSAYDRAVLENRGIAKSLNWICTYKAALRVWPDAPSYGNEALLYWLGLGKGRSEQQRTHSALHDAKVTAQVFRELYRAHRSLDDFVAWEQEEALLTKCPIGKHRGKPWRELPDSYLQWLLRAEDMRSDVKFAAKKEMELRSQLSKLNKES